MKQMIGWLGAVALLASVTVEEASAQRFGRRGGNNASRYGWKFSLRDGKAEARKTGKPLMVVFRCQP